MLDRDRIVSQLHSGYTVTVAEELPSTNTALKEMAAAGAPMGTVLIADRQTCGRGRLGRQFHSPEGGLYLSVLVPPADTVTCRAAVAAARAIGRLCDAKIDVKWVNDLFLNGRKVAGILAEGVLAPDGTLTAVVLGIGVNVGETTFPDELKPIATSLGNEGYALTREDLASAFLTGLTQTLCADVSVMDEYRRRNLVLGRQITVLRGGETYPATAEGITDDGHLVARTADGCVHELSSGEVSIRL
ncbi:MAG: biotin--[Clostridia bacterium]|nr:biotin--[acetyl-CoA-carboxylase] ligase [Clostridia bacterium]